MSIAEILRCIADFIEGRKTYLTFTKIVTNGTEIRGNIKMTKFEFNQVSTFTATPTDRRGNPAQIEAGTAEWSFVGSDMDGNDVSDSVTVEVNPDNELEATVTSGDIELTGVLTLRADGDPDAGEDAPVVATEDIQVDAGNVISLSLSHTEPTDV